MGNQFTDEERETLNYILSSNLKIFEYILKKDKCVDTTMIVQSDEGELVYKLSPKDGKTDIDKSLFVAISQLKATPNFNYATFAYSTKMGLSPTDLADGIKSIIIKPSGKATVFFTPYKIKGFFKKEVLFEQSMLSEVIENIFED